MEMIIASFYVEKVALNSFSNCPSAIKTIKYLKFENKMHSQITIAHKINTVSKSINFGNYFVPAIKLMKNSKFVIRIVSN